jgi:hypothetical protein
VYAVKYSHGSNTATAKVDETKDGCVITLGVKLGPDQYGGGGEGTYTITLKREASRYVGTHKGVYRGKDCSGEVRGAFTPKGWVVATGPKPDKTDLHRRSEAAFGELLKALQSGGRGGGLRGTDARLYATAGEIAEKAAAKKP